MDLDSTGIYYQIGLDLEVDLDGKLFNYKRSATTKIIAKAKAKEFWGYRNLKFDVGSARTLHIKI